MAVLFFILTVLASVILGFIILVQNPKGGGLAGNIGGFSNQLMGVKQTNDVLEKGTWIFSAIIGLLCLVSVVFFRGTNQSAVPSVLQKVNTNAPAQQAAPTNAAPVAPAPAK